MFFTREKKLLFCIEKIPGQMFLSDKAFLGLSASGNIFVDIPDETGLMG